MTVVSPSQASNEELVSVMCVGSHEVKSWIPQVFGEICVPGGEGGHRANMLIFHYVPGGAMLGTRQATSKLTMDPLYKS